MVEVDMLGVDILGVDISGVDILGVDILRLTQKWHFCYRTLLRSAVFHVVFGHV